MIKLNFRGMTKHALTQKDFQISGEKLWWNLHLLCNRNHMGRPPACDVYIPFLTGITWDGAQCMTRRSRATMSSTFLRVGIIFLIVRRLRSFRCWAGPLSSLRWESKNIFRPGRGAWALFSWRFFLGNGMIAFSLLFGN